ncbi:DNA-directed RNA polymerase I subunit RPA34 [Mixophyes fleayi]|uniref:DNA-directed RNA polymerase I subunit RPA34 n=1 Tax=Mixophyes fleayi TaxID=3061075 RepID=UPI003F4E0F96
MESAGEKCSFRCPLNFEPVAECKGSVSSEPDTEVWLIKAPADFTPESFNSHRLPLSGYKMQKIKVDGSKRFYHVMSSPCSNNPFRALLCPPESSEDSFVCAPQFRGIITLAEAHGDHTELHCVPDRPPLIIPEGLKQRYRPFGAIAPLVSPENAGHSQLSGSSKKKKKAKKRRREEAQLTNP